MNSRLSVCLAALLFAILIFPLSSFAHNGQIHPIAGFAFNEGNGSTTTDIYNQTGSIKNGALWTLGQFGKALSFDGANDVVDLGSPSSLDNVNIFTYCAWIYPKGLGGQNDGRILHKGTNTARKQFHIDDSTVNGLSLTVDRNGSQAKALSAANGLSMNIWQYVCGTYSETDGPRLYKNGAEMTYKSRIIGTGSTTDESASNFYVGNRGAFDKGWNGYIDELRIFNVIVPTANMITDMQEGVGIDNIYPSIPTNVLATPLSSSLINLTWASSTDNNFVSGYYIFRDGNQIGSATGTAFLDTNLNATSTYSYSIASVDGSGNMSSTSAPVLATTDAPPILTITSPQNNVHTVGSTLSVNYSTAGNMYEVDHVHFQLDSNSIVMDLTLDGVYQFNNVTAGNHTLNGFLVRSNHSKINGSDAVTINFSSEADPADTIPPTITLTSPNNGAILSGTTTVSATASDNSGSIAGVQFILDGTNLGAEDTAAPYSVSWNTISAINGSHVLNVIARDPSGNNTVSASTSVTVSNTSPNDPSVIGQWSPVINWPMVAVHMTLLPTGNLLLFDRMDMGGTAAQIWNPNTQVFSPVPNPTTDIFCTGHTFLSDGRVIVAGEHVADGVGTNESNVFNPFTGLWTALPNMHQARWYPNVVSLPDGRALVTSGSDTCQACVPLTQEIYDPKNNTWTELAARQYIPLYPFMFVLSNGQVLQAGAQAEATVTRKLDIPSQTWSVVDNREIDGGSAVMYGQDKIMKAGSWLNEGSVVPSAKTTFVIDMSQPNPSWRQTADMNFPRTNLSLTLLPDGTTLATGGDRTTSKSDLSQAVMEAEVWNPINETWKTMAPMQIGRLYHSSAVLLPDGRVITAGGGRSSSGATDEPSSQIFSPAYLFKGQRPVITAASTTIDYNSQFFVGTAATDIAKVSLIALGSDTHSFNMNQRYVPLNFSQTNGGLLVSTPGDANKAPPGYYMLFIVNSNGVPSIASFVQLPLPGADTEIPSAPMNLIGSTTTSSVSLSWSTSTDNVAVIKYNVYRSIGPNFTPSGTNRIAQVSTTTYIDGNLASSTYYYAVNAEDAAGNLSSKSNEFSATIVGQPQSGPTPLSYFRFNEGSGTITFDPASGLSGSLLNGVLWATGQSSQALSFDGANDVVDLGSPSILDNVNTLSYCAWIYPKGLGGQNDGRIIHKGTNSARKQFHIDDSTAYGLSLTIDRATTQAKALSVANALTPNQWQYVCGTYSETDGPRLFRDGAELSYKSRIVGAGATVDESASNFYIGNRSTADKGWNGLIDEVKIYNFIIPNKNP
jgi:chitodextrinase